MLGLGLANMATIVDPEGIILTGNLTAVSKWLIGPTQESFDTNVFQNIRNKVKLVISSLSDNDRNVLGAAALAWTVREYSLFK